MGVGMNSLEPFDVFRMVDGCNSVFAGEWWISDEGVHVSCAVYCVVVEWIGALRIENFREFEHPVECGGLVEDFALHVEEDLGWWVLWGVLEPLVDEGEASAEFFFAVFGFVVFEEGADDEVAEESCSGEGVFGVFEEGFLVVGGVGAVLCGEVEDALSEVDGVVEGFVDGLCAKG